VSNVLSLIVAYDVNHGIGKNNKLPWHYPEDLKYFKATTLGATVAMGRNTFLSIGRALPNRKNIVFTRDPSKLAGVQGIAIKTDPVAYFKTGQSSDDNIFVIGGHDIFELALPYVSRLYITEIDRTFDVDTYFPPVDMTKFKQQMKTQTGDLTYLVYEKEK